MRYRKNINCLTTNELHDLREALAGMFTKPAGDAYGFRMLAGFHGGPPTVYCPHGAPGFFTWHRAYLHAFENALREIRCDVALPYWDWSSTATVGVPKACREPTYVNRSGVSVPNPLYAGPARNGGMTQRRPDIDSTSFADLATTAQNAMTATTFSSFQSQINGVHGTLHGRVGGDMSGIMTAAFDPIFYLHHANVDRLWAVWQADHPGPLPATEASHDLAPFTKLYAPEYQEGVDTASTAGMGYAYRRFCIRLPRIRLWEVMQVDWHHHHVQEIRSARLVIGTAGTNDQAVEIRAFVDEPDASAATPTTLATFAGVIGIMGHGPASRPDMVRVKRQEAQMVMVAQGGPQQRSEPAPAPAKTGRGNGGDHSHGAAHEHAHEHGGDGHEHAGSGHEHGDGGHDHAGDGHADGASLEGRGPSSEAGDAVLIEVDLTRALRAAKSAATIKLVAVGSDGRPVRDADVGMTRAHLVVE